MAAARIARAIVRARSNWNAPARGATRGTGTSTGVGGATAGRLLAIRAATPIAINAPIPTRVGALSMAGAALVIAATSTEHTTLPTFRGGPSLHVVGVIGLLLRSPRTPRAPLLPTRPRCPGSPHGRAR